tara:strand:+ start:765 stop:1739 length:975 start_codon:yes stop_codon:yes gene_type:complete
MEFLTGLAEKVDTMLEDRTTSIVVSLVLALYAGLAAPKLPNSVVKFFDTMLGKVIFIFLIGFVASRNVQVALMIAVAYVVTLHIANKRATEEYINFLKRERFMNYYELFDVKEDNAKAVTDILCAKLPDAVKAHDDAESDEDKKVLKDGKFKADKKDLTLQQILVAADSKLADDKKIIKDGELDLAKAVGAGGLLEGVSLKKEDGSAHSNDSDDAKAAHLADLKKVLGSLKDKKVVEICKELAPAATEYFENFDEGPASGGQEDMSGDDDELEFLDEGYEEEPDDMEGMESDFHSKMEEFENFEVVPAHNLNGNSNKMYAPVSF